MVPKTSAMNKKSYTLDSLKEAVGKCNFESSLFEFLKNLDRKSEIHLKRP